MQFLLQVRSPCSGLLASLETDGVALPDRARWDRRFAGSFDTDLSRTLPAAGSNKSSWRPFFDDRGPDSRAGSSIQAAGSWVY